MSKGKFTASSGTALTVDATQTAYGAEINSDAVSAVVASSNNDAGTILAINMGRGAALATNCDTGPGVSASSHAGPGLVAVSDLAPGINAYSSSAPALTATSDSSTAVDAYSGAGPALTAFSEDSRAIIAQSAFNDAVVGYGNPNASAAVFVNAIPQVKRGGGGQVLYYQAAEFIGNVSITGNFSVSGAKGFRIDHPLQPTKMWLHHAAVESDAMKNIYSGTASLDSRGEAVISLPGWFEALNKDFTYLLTAIGASAPNLHIAREIRHNQFRIAGGHPKIKVSWQVTGVRKDAWASTHPFAIEETKSAKERGYSICPSAKPGRKGIKASLSPNIHERIALLDELKKSTNTRVQRLAALKKQQRKARSK